MNTCSSPPSEPESHNSSVAKSCVKWLTVGATLATGAVIVAPYVLPLVGVGESKDILSIMTSLHANPSGLAESLNKGLAAIPVIGETLAKGGVTTALASGAVGLGGMILGRYIGKREDGKHFIKWSKVISTTALATSALIALPTVLTSITAGIGFLASLYDTELASSALAFMKKTIGVAGSESLAAAGISTASLALPHLLTCGAGAMPALVSFGMNCHKPKRNTPSPCATTPEAAPVQLDQSPVTAIVKLEKPTSAFEEARGVLVLRHTASGAPLTAEELKTVHTEKVHFLIVDSSLKDFHHIHPTPTDVAGEYAFSFTPQTSNRYSGWADITPQQTTKNLVIKTDLSALLQRNIPAKIRQNSLADAAKSGLTFEWKSDKPLVQGQSTDVEVAVRDASGKPVTELQPLLGAYAHLVGFSADGKSLIHAHPMGAEPKDETCRSIGNLHFHVKPETAGAAQFYLQVKRNGQEITAPFGQTIAPAHTGERIQPRSFLASTSASAHSCVGIA